MDCETLTDPKKTYVLNLDTKLFKALSVTVGVKVVLENMSRQGHTIGGDLSELRYSIL